MGCFGDVEDVDRKLFIGIPLLRLAPPLLPDCNAAKVAGPAIPSAFGITSNLRLAHFLAQCALESINSCFR